MNKLQQRAKKIIDWIEAYSYLVDQESKYLELGINETDKKRANHYQEIADHYVERIERLINARP